MRIKNEEYEYCDCCGQKSRQKSPPQYACDECNIIIPNISAGLDNLGRNTLGASYMDLTVYDSINGVELLQLCSWKCVIAKVRKLKPNDFVNLPSLVYWNTGVPGQTVDDFLKLLKD